MQKTSFLCAYLGLSKQLIFIWPSKPAWKHQKISCRECALLPAAKQRETSTSVVLFWTTVPRTITTTAGWQAQKSFACSNSVQQSKKDWCDLMVTHIKEVCAALTETLHHADCSHQYILLAVWVAESIPQLWGFFLWDGHTSGDYSHLCCSCFTYSMAKFMNKVGKNTCKKENNSLMNPNLICPVQKHTFLGMGIGFNMSPFAVAARVLLSFMS